MNSVLDKSGLITRKRGRPKIERETHDTGTPELAMKRQRGETAEALDLCLERGIITPEQHWCGIHLRWLHTLRHGAPGIRAIDPTHLGGIDTKSDDPEWREAREKEYQDAMQKLTMSGYISAIITICIYNERPRFLSLNKPVELEHHEAISELITHLRNGLDILCKHWNHRK